MSLETQLARAEEIMKERGLKITNQRMLVIETLFKHPHAHSVYKLLECDDELKDLNPVTLYRILEVLVRVGIAHRVSGNEFRACDLSEEKDDANKCHLLFICDECGAVEEGKDDHLLEYEMAKKQGFTVFSHVNELHGVCKKCQYTK